MRKPVMMLIFLGLMVMLLGTPARSEEEKKKKEEKKSGIEQFLDLGLSVLEATRGMMPFTYEEERALGQSVAIEVMARHNGAYMKEVPNIYVNKVGLAISRYSDRPNIPYRFAILNSEEANAFACPGGYIFLTLGLVKLLRDEAELAGVLAHEIAHVTHKHALTTIQRNRIVQGIGRITMAAMQKDPEIINQLTTLTTEILFTRGVDKEMEFEADRKGTEYAYRTGYDPGGLMRFIRTLQEYRGSKRSVWFSTHPDTDQRIRLLNTQVLPAFESRKGLITNQDRFLLHMQ